ncbi:MAG: CcmD family protein [Acidobacteria bacterium]|nr:CcmD family protein [Acidobacteriota bacterium]
MDTRNFTYMFYGFAAAWLIVVIYVVTLVLRERRLSQEMQRLRDMLSERRRT